ncbi:MAG: GIY-YIG nuclease family protein [Candidatus Thorarchaeota archaeon]|jgi:sugar fermentation stimulation protein A
MSLLTENTIFLVQFTREIKSTKLCGHSVSFSYILVMDLPSDATIQIGTLGTIHFPKGSYAYVGSAPSENRLERHLRREKTIHWHIDYFLQEAAVKKIVVSPQEECILARQIPLPYIKGFGCSDCRCPSHLFCGDVPFIESLEQYYPR